jgi:hypothetical protein
VQHGWIVAADNGLGDKADYGYVDSSDCELIVQSLRQQVSDLALCSGAADAKVWGGT